MRTSVLWINDYLDRPADAAEQAAVLTAAGLPLDGGATADNGEVWQEIETTSRRRAGLHKRSGDRPYKSADRWI